MEHPKTVYETVTEEGTYVRVDADLPAKDTIKEKTISALTEASLPSNREIKESLEEAKYSIESSKRQGNLDEQGRLLANDAEEIIDVAERALREKNKDEKLQKLFEDTRQAMKETKPIIQEEAKKMTEELKYEGKGMERRGQYLGREAQGMAKEVRPQAERVQKDTQQLIQSLKDFFFNFIKSEDFRRLIADWIAFTQFLATRKIKEVAQKQTKEEEESVTANIAKAVDEGLQQPMQPADQEELERRTQEKFNELLKRVQSKPEYKKALRDFFELIDQIQDRLEVLYQDTRRITGLARVGAQERAMRMRERTQEELALHEARQKLWDTLYDARDILGEFAGHDQLDQFMDTLWEVYVSTREDEDLHQWFRDFKAFLNDIVNSPDVVLSDVKQEEGKMLLYRGRMLLQKEKWSNLYDRLQREFNVLLDNIRNDSTTNEFMTKIKKFAEHFVFNREGLPDLYVLEDSLVQIKNLLTPMFKQQLEKIHIGRVEFSNDTYDVEIRDIGFSGSFLPEHIDFHMRNDSRIDTRDSSRSRTRHILQFRIAHVKPEFHNLKFHYRRKSFPKIEDWGIADLNIAGSGATILVTWVISARGQRRPIAQLAEVLCDIDKLDIHLVDSKHDILDRMAIPFLQSNLKSRIQTGVEDILIRQLNDLNIRLNEFLQARPLEKLHEKANVSLQEGYKKTQISSQ